MSATILFGSFTLLLVIGVPIGVALGMASLLTLVYSNTLPLEFITQSMITSIDSFPLLAILFFILAGEIMGKGGVSSRLFNVAETIVGNRTGGFAIATIITCMFFAAISGSGPATVAAVGGIMIPAMVRMGYDKKFAAALVAAAGSLGIIIPPSIPMVLYGISGGVSIGNLFIAGILPGILIALALMCYAYYYSNKMGYRGNGIPFSFPRLLKSTWDAKWALLTPLIILGGIYGGIFTPTEAAAIAVVYGLIAGLLLYRELKIRDLPKVFADSATLSAAILLIVAAATAFGKLMTIEQIPAQVSDAMLAISDNPSVLIILITLLLLFVGCFMDTGAAIIILTPILLPIVVELGYSPLHFGIMMTVNLAIGFITPPMGVNLFMASGISGVPVETLVSRMIPFFLVLVFVLMLIVYIPQISLVFVE